jgi:hypothetical protein
VSHLRLAQHPHSGRSVRASAILPDLSVRWRYAAAEATASKTDATSRWAVPDKEAVRTLHLAGVESCQRSAGLVTVIAIMQVAQAQVQLTTGVTTAVAAHRQPQPRTPAIRRRGMLAVAPGAPTR